MQLITQGLVLRATKTGEADRVLVLLTPEHGVISAIAKGSLRMKSKLFSATGLFCYSEFTLFEGKNLYQVDSAMIKQVFWGIHEQVEQMALAMYLSEFATVLSPTGEESKEILNLLLNTFYISGKNKHPLIILKAIFELRALSLTGYLPALTGCASCMRYDGCPFYFDAENGLLLCEECAKRQNHQPNLDAAALRAMRHIMLCEPKQLFSFALSKQSSKLLAHLSQRYVDFCLGQTFHTLSFLNTILSE